MFNTEQILKCLWLLVWPGRARYSPYFQGVHSLECPEEWEGRASSRSDHLGCFFRIAGPYKLSSCHRRFWQSEENWIKVLSKMIRNSQLQIQSGYNLIYILVFVLNNFHPTEKLEKKNTMNTCIPFLLVQHWRPSVTFLSFLCL